jgi:hypothetical protein
MKRDLKNEIIFGNAGSFPETTDGAGYVFDLAQLPSATLLVSTTTLTSIAGAGITIKLQHSDTVDSGFVDCTASEIIGASIVLTSATWSLPNAPVGAIGYRGNKRYLRAHVDKASTTDTGIVGLWLFTNLPETPAGRKFMPDEATFTPAINDAFTNIYLSSGQIVT